MRSRLLPTLAAAWLAAVPLPARAADAEPAAPTVVVRLQPLDNLLANARYLASYVGREEQVKQLDGVIQALAGQQGQTGIDTRRPFGFYGTLGPAVVDSAAVVLIPVAN